MEQLVKQFTLIDYLGILAPGGIFALAVNFYVLDLTSPFVRFFGENAFMLSLYFMVLGYLCGSVLHHLGSVLENWLCKANNLHSDYYKKQVVKDAYKQCFGTELSTENADAGKDIFHYVQRRERPQRIIIFSAFYTMSRTLVVTLSLVMLITVFCNLDRLSEVLHLLIAYAAAIIVFLERWKRFEKKCIDEAYMLFITEYTNQQKPPQE